MNSTATKEYWYTSKEGDTDMEARMPQLIEAYEAQQKRKLIRYYAKFQSRLD